MDRPEPSAANLMPSVLGGDSSSSEDTGDVGLGGDLPSDNAEARNGSHDRPADTMVLEVSEDESESQPPSTFWSIMFRPQAQSPACDVDMGNDAYHLHLSKLSSLFGDFVL
jgi:hypothetical protein